MTHMVHPASTDEGIDGNLLQMRGITRVFPGVRALDSLDFGLDGGEVHVLLGENGAGKSTLISIMAGALKPTAGEIRIEGEPVEFNSPRHARSLGVAAVWQEFSLVRSMSVAENLFMGAEPTRFGLLARRRMNRRAQEFLDELGFDIPVNAPVEALARGRQQMVEIAKALLADPRVMIFDEPTASLTEAESARLFEFIGRLKERNVGVVYISHRMKEIRDLADRITILRDGRRIATVPNDDRPDEKLIALMNGRALSEIYPPKRDVPAAPRLEVRGLSLRDGGLQDVSLTLSKGEIVGIAGLVGCGKSELGRALFGLEPVAAGDVLLNGAPFAPQNPDQALAVGVCYFPSDRATEGLALDRSVLENASMAALKEPLFSRRGLLRKEQERTEISRVLKELNLRPLLLYRPAGSFSGGNKQKVVLARGLIRDVSLFVFDEPTVGIDVSAKAEIYAIMERLAAEGASVLLISSELPEVIGMSHRVYVMNKGRIAGELRGADITEEAILPHFFSH